MNKRIFLGFTMLVIMGIAAGCVNPGNSSTIKPSGKGDSLRFKEEYEALNSELDEDGANKYVSLSINEDNNIIYLTYDELLDFIDNKVGLLYFGRPACPWCRLLIPCLLDFAKENSVNIYYYDIEKDREENNDRYKNILAIFGEYLPTDTVTQDEDDPGFDPFLKRVVLPHLFFMKDGKAEAEINLFQHEYLEDNDPVKLRQLLKEKYDLIDIYSGNKTVSGGCKDC